MLVDEKQVFGRMHQILSQYADIDIIVSVVIDIDDADAGGPDVRRQSRFFGDILELIIPLVDVQPAAHLVARKEDVLASVVVEIADTYPSAHISELVDERHGGVVVVKIVAKMDAGLIGLQLGKKRALRFVAAIRHSDHGQAW